MKKHLSILILGATGFVGAHLVNQLTQCGHRIVCCVRDVTRAKKQFPHATILSCDFLKDTQIECWLERLDSIDVIINCVGVFYHSKKEILWTLHYETPKALFLAAEQSQVKKIIHLSALGVDLYETEYAKSKRAAEDCLKLLSTPYIILRPSFIYGAGSRGGMALIRSLSTLPFFLPIPAKGQQAFQPIHVEDLTTAIVHLVQNPQVHNVTLAAVSSKKITLKEMMSNIRDWFKLKSGYVISIPLGPIKMLAGLGNYIPFSTFNTDAISMLERGNYTSVKEAKIFQKLAKVNPMPFVEGLHRTEVLEPDLWYAKLLLLKPLLRLSLALMWLGSALTSFLFPTALSYKLLYSVGVSTALAPLFLYAAITLNFILGLSLLLPYKTRMNCILQLMVMSIYTAIITLKLPYLWLEPFGPVLKNIPIFVSVLVLYSMEKD